MGICCMPPRDGLEFYTLMYSIRHSPLLLVPWILVWHTEGDLAFTASVEAY